MELARSPVTVSTVALSHGLPITMHLLIARLQAQLLLTLLQPAAITTLSFLTMPLMKAPMVQILQAPSDLPVPAHANHKTPQHATNSSSSKAQQSEAILETRTACLRD